MSWMTFLQCLEKNKEKTQKFLNEVELSCWYGAKKNFVKKNFWTLVA